METSTSKGRPISSVQKKPRTLCKTPGWGRFAALDILPYRLIHPEVTASEVIAFLYTMYGISQNPPIEYTSSQITRAELSIRLSLKRAAKTARQALSRRIPNWRYNYWH